jgi:ankyrin repeat protein
MNFFNKFFRSQNEDRLIIINDKNKKNKFNQILESQFTDYPIKIHEIKFISEVHVTEFFKFLLKRCKSLQEKNIATLISSIINILPEDKGNMVKIILKKFLPLDSCKLITCAHEKLYYEFTDRYSNSCMFYIKSLDELTLLIDKIDINQKNKDGDNFLQYLTKNNKLDWVTNYSKLLISLDKAGFNFNSKNKNSVTLFVLAIKYCNKQLIDHLLKIKGINFKVSSDENNWLYILLHSNLKASARLDIIFDMINHRLLEPIVLNTVFDIFKSSISHLNLNQQITELIELFTTCDKKFTQKCLLEPDSNNNTIIHKMAEYRNKKGLSYILMSYDIKVGKNKDGLYPFDLFDRNNLKRKLLQINNQLIEIQERDTVSDQSIDNLSNQNIDPKTPPNELTIPTKSTNKKNEFKQLNRKLLKNYNVYIDESA